jgi:DNA polymerase III delta subunit
MIGAIARGYRHLLLAQELMRQNAANEEIAKAVGMSPYAVKYLNERARKVETVTLLQALARIAETDIALKTSRATPRLQLELLICELCPQASAKRTVFHAERQPSLDRSLGQPMFESQAKGDPT